ncbi:DUF4231 domain-containing protein [Streptomyces sp. NPDC079020]|uniref:DUF4231 domain-containing protein n=1 Tax=Streptomyces sp. NPDC079020 TaxID=3365722 RepID=UPI0037D8AABE
MTAGFGVVGSPPSESEERLLQEEYRNRVREFDQIESDLRASRTFQRVYWLCLMGSVLLSVLLGYTVVVGLWQTKPIFARYVGLLVVVGLVCAMSWLLLKNGKVVVGRAGDLRNALQDRQTAAAGLPLDSPSGLRIYREASLDLIAQYRKSANNNRRIHNFFQLVIITGSIATSTLTAMNEGANLALRVITATLSALVGISAGVTGYFKFRERGYNLQSTADEIEKHYNASQFMLDEYVGADGAGLTEGERLRKYAGFVERLKEEQRKRELQLEQSSSSGEERAG